MKRDYQIVVIGVSAGGLEALSKVIPAFGRRSSQPFVQDPDSAEADYMPCATIKERINHLGRVTVN